MEDEAYEAKINILSLQKEIMNAVLDYQMNYGPESIAWNVTISFNETRKV
jgi:hypothetical protein